MITLRPYQIEAVEKAAIAFQTNDHVLEVLATGLGKTTIASELAKTAKSTLFLAHRKELVEQAEERLRDYTGRPVGVEMASRHSDGEDIIVGSVQSVKTRTIAPPELIIVDEAHHAVSATYQEVLGRFPNSKVLGLTATADRADGISLGSYFQKVAFRYETPQAIRDGWLARIETVKASGVAGLRSLAGNRKTIVFTPTVKEARLIARELPNATHVHGELSKNTRTKRVEGFKQGRYQFIVNCNILTEGFDSPDVECIAMLRATESRAMFVQCLGRGLRLAPGKQTCLYLDLVDMPKHSLEGPRNALAGKEAPSFLPKNSFWRKFF